MFFCFFFLQSTDVCVQMSGVKVKKNSILKYGYQSQYSQGPLKEPITNQPLFIASTFPRLSFAPPLSALQAALRLAEEISSFPQQCLRADRSSAIYSSYDAPSFKQVKPPLAPLSPCSAVARGGGRGRGGVPLGPN